MDSKNDRIDTKREKMQPRKVKKCLHLLYIVNINRVTLYCVRTKSLDMLNMISILLLKVQGMAAAIDSCCACRNI